MSHNLKSRDSYTSESIVRTVRSRRVERGRRNAWNLEGGGERKLRRK
jgi:hypothetical protein